MTSPSPTDLASPAPAAAVSDSVIAELLRSGYGLAAPRVSALPSTRNRQLLVVEGERCLVLTVSTSGKDRSVVAMELAALSHIAGVDAVLPVPRVVPTLEGGSIAVVTGGDREHAAHLVTAVPGRIAEGLAVTERLAEAVGAAAARTSLALQGFFHPAAGRALDRDLRRLPDVLAQVPQPQWRPHVQRMADRVADSLAATLALPSWVQHGDLTLATVRTGHDERPDQVTGIVGLGDLHHTAAVCDLAATLASVLRDTSAGQTRDLWRLAAAVLRGYQRHRPLQPDEADVLGELVIARLTLTLTLAISSRPEPIRGGADDSTHPDISTQRVLDALAALEPEALRARMRRLTGLAAPGISGIGTHDLLSRRRAVQGGALSPLFYAEPLDIVRGEGVWLIGRDGRRYLDGYNNVAVVGHSHPSVVQAITRQAGLLHTHSRYLHPNVVELAERLIASMPAGSGLDTCLFTTSGTEANELAWRLATGFTGGTGAVIGSHAYHGASKQMADLSSNEWPPGYRPTGVATFPGPVEKLTTLTGDEAMRRIAAAAAELDAAGGRAAMVIADSMFTSEGVRPVPGAFATGLVEGAHAAGALYVADEVQIGFGRTGEQLWWFAALGITPDVVTLGKPMGAGYPIAAVLTRREIADALAARYEFFSTFAANPVGAAASLAVLDLLADGEIPAGAVVVGEQLRRRVAALRGAHPVIGDVRGVGLIAGIDLGSRQRARAVVEALKARGVLVGSTGRRGDVLKVRPPLLWQREHVALFVDALDEALAELG